MPVILLALIVSRIVVRDNQTKYSQARATGVLKATHVKGQYIRDPNYKECCLGVSKRDWGKFLLNSDAVLFQLGGWRS